jgi:RND family efflux transporter MFP subunit
MLKRRTILEAFAGAAAMAAVGAGLWWWVAPATVFAVHPARGTAVEAVYASGTVEPSVMTVIAPRIGARLTTLEADEGDTVSAGQVLARLESADVRSSLAQLRAQAELARRDYARAAQLVQGGNIARAVYDKAKAAWEAARAAVEAAQAQAGYMQLIAPGPGRVIRRDGEIGEFIAVNQPVFWLWSRSPLRVTAEVDEEDVSSVLPGQEVLLRADAFAGRVFTGTVTSVTPKGDPVARSYRVRIALPEGSPFQIGMTAEANIVTRRNAHALLIPSAALDGNVVWVIEAGRLRRRMASLGARGDEKTEIRAGLTEKDLVVSPASTTFREGMRVRAGIAP